MFKLVFACLPVLVVVTLRSQSIDSSTKPVSTTYGQVSGALTSDGKVAIFKGIPYSAPPVGPLRWREPHPPHKWSGVRDATMFSHNCVQKVVHELLPWTKEFMLRNDVSEDCLYLNVWTGGLNRASRLPVYVFIHGGAFSSGSGDVQVYDGEALARQGLIVVTLNYRLGVLGFLAHPWLTAESPHHASGNYGLLDQLAALRWVKENIAAFGGDPNRITVGGQSAGAMSVRLMLASPLSKGLFERSVAESGIGLVSLPAPSLSQAERNGEEFAKSEGATSLQGLRRIPWEELSDGARPSGDASKTALRLRFSPIVDGWYLPAPLAEFEQRKQQNDVPVMTGWNADEFFGVPKSAADFRSRSEARYGSFAKQFLSLYPAGSDGEALASYKAAALDRNRVSTYLWALERSKTARTSAYTYSFTRAIPWPEHPEFGAFHTGEVPYIFDNLNCLDRPWTALDHELARMFSSYLVNFASAGNPNGKDVPTWPAYDAGAKVTMEIGQHSGPIPLASANEEKFWLTYFASPQSKNEPFL